MRRATITAALSLAMLSVAHAQDQLPQRYWGIYQRMGTPPRASHVIELSGAYLVSKIYVDRAVLLEWCDFTEIANSDQGIAVVAECVDRGDQRQHRPPAPLPPQRKTFTFRFLMPDILRIDDRIDAVYQRIAP